MLYGITAASEPDYDDWGFDTYWRANDWVTWYRNLKVKFGTNGANARFLQAWNKSGNFSSNLDYPVFNSAFKGYFSNVPYVGGGTMLSAIRSGQIPIVTDLLSKAVTVLETGTDSIEQTTQSAASIVSQSTTLLKYAWIPLLIGAGYLAYQNRDKFGIK